MISPILKMQLQLVENKVTIAPVSDPNYQAVYYAQAQNYTLVGWEVSRGEETISGENLWYKFNPLATAGGQLQLAPVADSEDDIWEVVPYRDYNLPGEVATELRSLKSLRWF